jgi:hypothetical protein
VLFFVFNGDTVGAQNYVEDFHQHEDKIEFSGVTGVPNGADTVITTPHDSVTLVGFAGALTAHDFIIV